VQLPCELDIFRQGWAEPANWLLIDLTNHHSPPNVSRSAQLLNDAPHCVSLESSLAYFSKQHRISHIGDSPLYMESYFAQWLDAQL
jgi:hypothetical protein